MKRLFSTCLALFAALCLLALSAPCPAAPPPQVAPKVAKARQAQDDKPGQLPSIARKPYISALAMDAATGEVLFEDNADAQVYPASMLKLMVLYITLTRIESGQMALTDMVGVTKEAADMGGSQVYLDVKEQFPVEEMLYALMVQSANDAATALAIHIAGSREAFIGLMNQTARQLGMNSTTFRSEHGLPPGKGQSPDVTTARDMAILCRELARRPETFKYSSVQARSFRNGKFTMTNHNKLLGQSPGVDGLKTGYFRAAGFSVAATAPQKDRRAIVLVMGSEDRRERDAKALELLRSSLFKLSALPPPQPQAKAPEPAAQPEAAAPAAQKQSVSQPAQTGAGGGWGKFFLGLGLGLLAFLAIVLIAGRLTRSRRRRGGLGLRR